MRQTVRLGRFAGIPVGVHWSVFVIMGLLVQGLAMAVLPAGSPGHRPFAYWGTALIVAVLFLAALLAHELAHALVARRYGIRVRAITLWLLGGVSELDAQARHPLPDLLIALAGPVTSLAGAGVFGAAAVLAAQWGAGSLAVTSLAWLAVVNLALGVFNLLPAAPLDGGRVLAAVMWWVRGDRAAARRTAGRAGMVLGTMLAALGVLEILLAANLGGLWLIVLGWFLTSAARAETTDLALRDSLANVRVVDAMTMPAVCGYTTQTVTVFVTTVVRRLPHRAYPVLDLDGHLVSLVTLTALTRVPPTDRDTVRLGAVPVPADRIPILRPDTALVEAASALISSGHRLAPVVTADRLVGVLTAGDIARAVELSQLGTTPARGDQPSSPLHAQTSQPSTPTGALPERWDVRP